MSRCVLVREQYFDSLVNIVAGARTVGAAYKVYGEALKGDDKKRIQLLSDVLIGKLENLKEPLQALEEIEAHLSALGEGAVMSGHNSDSLQSGCTKGVPTE